jgi:hypothetical protein
VVRLSRPRVVYAHQKGLLKAEVLDFLSREPLDLEVREHEPEEGYYYLLEELWAQAQDFVLCEWDNLPYAGAIQEIWDCPEIFCGKPYRIGWFYAACLGCTKISRELMLEFPQAVKMGGARKEPSWGQPGYKHWNSLDSRIVDALRELGYEGDHNWGGMNWGWPHQHWPIIEHLHDYSGVSPPRNGPLPKGITMAPRQFPLSSRPDRWGGENLQFSFGFAKPRLGRQPLTRDGQRGSPPLSPQDFNLLDPKGRAVRPATFWVPEQEGPTLGQVFCQITAEQAGPPRSFALSCQASFPDGQTLVSSRVLQPVLEFGSRLPVMGRRT